MRLIVINNIHYNTDIAMEIQHKADFLKMVGEGGVDEDGDKMEAMIFSLSGTDMKYGFGEGICYQYNGDLK